MGVILMEWGRSQRTWWNKGSHRERSTQKHTVMTAGVCFYDLTEESVGSYAAMETNFLQHWHTLTMLFPGTEPWHQSHVLQSCLMLCWGYTGWNAEWDGVVLCRKARCIQYVTKAQENNTTYSTYRTLHGNVSTWYSPVRWNLYSVINYLPEACVAMPVLWCSAILVRSTRS